MKLDCTKARQELGWSSRWSLEKSIEEIVRWQKEFSSQRDMKVFMREQINLFNQIKAEYNDNTIKWYLTNLNLYNKFLEYSIIKP